MKLKSIRDIAILGLAVLALSVPGILRANGDFSQIYFFGDSLSDSGNVFALTGFIATPPYDEIPSAPYAIGGHHFSNGKTWTEVFAQRMKLVEGGKAALENFVTNGNFAFGGARARSFGDSPSALQQVSLYFSVHDTADSNALYVLQFGGNDLRDAVGAFFLIDPTGALSNLILAQAIQSIKDNIELLYNSGARHFLVANAPNLARTPAIISSGPPVIDKALEYGEDYNEMLELILGGIETDLTDISIDRIDFFGLVNHAADMPEEFGITITDFPCLNFGVQGGANCSNPGEYLFWDDIHPTKKIHNAIGEIAADLFSH